MKRKLIAGIVTLALGAMLVPAAFAAVDNNQSDSVANSVYNNTQNRQFFNQMFEWHKTWLDNAVKNGQLTEDQAKVWTQHFDQMKEFHSKYGMGPMAGMMGNFNGSGFGPGMMGNFNGTGFGPGMMGNFGNQASK
ncbi:hypothetical protein Desca_2414 [Desulfotomaculum nigrificans CO-1-SRB]|uniref:DUF2680 domain-containing protein n=1 Tax=Desulfotomaculum nigrificans (strain DSM 14880 / VKM B-2319 / CO-1-SRB) TaxID=868595 RepID=F6B3T4_DESCC|nr:DUF2680 domain-containing protein [Desulfotomaculum nigrificans]AEF95243.1 hypothetical protein Desca_2414 [Desulfotomaculum nigrificans CO-1-SRB]